MPRYTNEQIIAALTETKGMLYLAAESLGCNHETITERAKRSEEVARCLKQHRGRRVDEAELKLDQAIGRCEAWAVSLMLKTQGKDRGYYEKAEVDVRILDALIERELARVAGREETGALEAPAAHANGYANGQACPLPKESEPPDVGSGDEPGPLADGPPPLELG